MTAQFYILSLREERQGPAYACVVELEDVMVSNLNAQLLTTDKIEIIARVTKDQNIQRSPKYLFLVGIAFGDVIQLLKYARGYLDSFDGVYAYVFDSILFDSELNKPDWKKSFSSYFRLAKKITRLFVPVQYSIKQFEQCFDIAVSYIPLASDVLKFGDASDYKFIDVNGYGRQDLVCSKLLANAFNQRGTNKFYYHTDHITNISVVDNYSHRRFFWQLLRASKIALAFDAMSANNNNRFSFSFVGQRWFESTAAGCVVVGRRPTCPEMNKLFPSINSTIEMPSDSKSVIPFMEALLANDSNLQAIGLNNYLHALEKNDWRYRLFDMLIILNIKPPQQLLDDINLLELTLCNVKKARNH